MPPAAPVVDVRRPSAPACRSRRQAPTRARTRARLAAGAFAALSALPVLGNPGGEPLTELPLERLLQTEVVSAASFARQVTDATSAVSVLTAEEIRIHGLRTLGEILDHMRGIHISHTLDYVFMGARGAGGDMIASRVLTLVDGNPPPDNLYDQTYFGRDALVDVAMIERVEYAPGTGSALYGNNALLGVVNIVTKRGRDLDGVQVSVGSGDWRQRTWRLSAGQREPSGLEWLLSYTLHHDSGMPATEVGDLGRHYAGRSETALAKAQWGGFSALLMTAQRRVVRDYMFLQPAEDAWIDASIDRNALLALGHDSEPAEHWRLSLKAQHGRYAYRFNDLWGGERYEDANDGRWWALNAQAGYDGWRGHRVALGLRLRDDPVQDFFARDYDGSTWQWRGHVRSHGLSVEDQWQFDDHWSLSAGLRADQRDGAPWTFSPRLGAVWQATPAWSLKASSGRAALHPSANESIPGDEDDPPLPRDATLTATTSELVSEYREGGLRVLGSLYRFTTRNPVGENVTSLSAGGRGAELEVEWQSRGWRLRGSQAWQDAEPPAGQLLYYSPRQLTKLQVSAPLAGEALRLSATARHVGRYRVVDLGPVPARTLLDLTLVSQQALPGLDVRVGWRNLLQRRDREAEADQVWPPVAHPTSRSAWIELTGTFR